MKRTLSIAAAVGGFYLASFAIIAASPSAAQSPSRESDHPLRKKTLPFDAAVDRECWVTGCFRDGALEKLCISLGLSSARLEWAFSLDAGRLGRFEVRRKFYRWDPERVELDSTKTDHVRSIGYVFRSGKLRTGPNGNKGSAHDEKWDERTILKVLEEAKEYLSTERREQFESKMDELLTKGTL